MARAGLGLQGSSLGDAQQSGVVSAFVQCPEGEGRCGAGGGWPSTQGGLQRPWDEELRGPLGPGRLQRCGREGAGFSETAATFPKPLWLEVDKSVSLGLRFARVGWGGRPWAGSPGSPFAKGGGVHANGALGSGVLATCCCLSGRPGLAPFRPAPPCGGPVRREPGAEAARRPGLRRAEGLRDSSAPSVWRPFPPCVLVGPRFFPTCSPQDMESRRAVRAPAASLALSSRAVAGAAAPGRSDARGGLAF